MCLVLSGRSNFHPVHPSGVETLEIYAEPNTSTCSQERLTSRGRDVAVPLGLPLLNILILSRAGGSLHVMPVAPFVGSYAVADAVVENTVRRYPDR